MNTSRPRRHDPVGSSYNDIIFAKDKQADENLKKSNPSVDQL